MISDINNILQDKRNGNFLILKKNGFNTHSQLSQNKIKTHSDTYGVSLTWPEDLWKCASELPLAQRNLILSLGAQVALIDPARQNLFEGLACTACEDLASERQWIFKKLKNTDHIYLVNGQIEERQKLPHATAHSLDATVIINNVRYALMFKHTTSSKKNKGGGGQGNALREMRALIPHAGINKDQCGLILILSGNFYTNEIIKDLIDIAGNNKMVHIIVCSNDYYIDIKKYLQLHFK